jgi:hypothetical protein
MQEGRMERRRDWIHASRLVFGVHIQAFIVVYPRPAQRNSAHTHIIRREAMGQGHGMVIEVLDAFFHISGHIGLDILIITS